MGAADREQSAPGMRRDNLDILIEILSNCEIESIGSQVCRQCNLSWYEAMKRVDLMVQLKMIEETVTHGEYRGDHGTGRGYRTTQYGKEVLAKLTEIKEIFTIKQ